MSIQTAELGDDEPLVVSPRRARRMLDCGNTRLYELIAARELESFKDGRSRKITVTSIKAYIARLEEGR
jgi:excisionase family DNA binding protein